MLSYNDNLPVDKGVKRKEKTNKCYHSFQSSGDMGESGDVESVLNQKEIAIIGGVVVLISKISYPCTRMVLYELVDSRSFLGY